MSLADEHWWSVADLAEKFKVCQPTVRKWFTRGLRFVKLNGRAQMVPDSWLCEWLEAQGRATSDELKNKG